MFYTVVEVAKVLNVPVAQVYALVHTKGFPCKRIGRHYRIHKVKLEQWAMNFSGC
jgi:excisionase family DNA binding protein